MKVEQIYTGCLAEAAYYVVSKGEAVMIDPLRETKPYTDRLEADNATLKYIFLTHFHADFVSGHLDLAKKTGATIVFGPTAETKFEFHSGTDNEEFVIGDVKLKLIHTPGHTLESSSYLLFDKNNKEQCLFSGDTLFIGDVGRPDLAVKQGDYTKEDLAKSLFKSLRTKVMTLPDDIIIYPNHGAGSACGKNMSKETYDTLGNQKKLNYALRYDMTEEEFVTEVLHGLAPPPVYFPKNVAMNKSVNPEIDAIIEKGTKVLGLQDVQEQLKSDTIILDVRHQDDFIAGFIPGSIFIGLNGQFAPWVGTLIKNIDQKIILVTPEGKEEEAVTRLSRIGYDNVQGIFKDGVNIWSTSGQELDAIKKVSPEEFEQLTIQGDVNILDVRKDGEFKGEHIVGAEHLSLDKVNSNLDQLDKDKTYYVHCAGGYRSVIFESIAKSKGIHQLIDIGKGYNGLKNLTKLERTEFICPSTL